MEYAATRVKTTAAASFLLLLVLALAWSGAAPAAEPNCPFAGKRPPLEEILKVGSSHRSSLCKANLTGTNLARTDLSGTNLAGANLKGTNLTGTDLSGTNLAGANLTGTHLTGADLTGANLGSADLRQTSLTGVKGLTCDQVHAAKRDRPTKLPDMVTCD